MNAEGNIRFMENKIDELGTALFSTPGASLWKFPVALISNAKADEEGNIWFVLRNVALVDELKNACFYVQLQFYNKDQHYYLRVEGDAKIVCQQSEVPKRFQRITDGLYKNEFLIKLRVCQARFYNREKKQQSVIL